MPLYTMRCPTCDQGSEHLMGRDDNRWTEVKCPTCGAALNRSQNRDIQADKPMIAGDTVTRGVNLSGYYDAGLGEWVKSRGHRRELMERKGLEEYSPDPVMQHHRDEAKYITDHAPRGDRSAAAAARKERKTASDKRRNRIVETTLRKHEI